MTVVIRHTSFAAATVLVALLSGWLLTGESSPASGYFINHVALPNVWRSLNLPPYTFAAVIGGNVHQPSFLLFAAAFVIQWALVGVVLSLALRKLWPNNSSKRTGLRPAA